MESILNKTYSYHGVTSFCEDIMYDIFERIRYYDMYYFVLYANC